MNNGIVSLREIINKVLFEKDQGGMHKFLLFKNYGIDLLRKLHTGVLREVKTTKIEMSALKTIELPTDCAAIVKVGVQVGDKVRVFLRDHQIALMFDKDDCGNEVANSPATPTTSDDDEFRYPFYFANYINDYGEHKGGFYGYGSGVSHEAYEINGRTIYFNSDIETTNVYLEYVSTGFNPTEETLVPVIFTNAIKTYIKWQYAADKVGPNSSEARGWQQLHGKEMTDAKLTNNPITIEDILNASRSGYMLSPKS
jgi:hypothetical protein